ncbi:hypothetical protein [Brevundimonas sp.]|uniref:hypothetical protein n=1 Tax=Brevundimonas sp. TaxID=1871086 RepID=UPI0028A1EE18|nr:hypothetical protein [Brevundimonas sp.]
MKLSTGRALLTIGLSLLTVVAVNLVWFWHGGQFMLMLCATYLLGVVGANLAYGHIQKRWSYRGAAYSGAILVFVLVCYVSAELMARSMSDDRAPIFMWVFSYGFVALVSWLALDLALRGRLEHSKIWVKPVLAAVAVGCIAWAGWYSYSSPVARVMNPSPKDCALMVQALKDFSPDGFEQGIRLNTKYNCDWVALGLPESSLRESEPKSITGLWAFDPWFSVGKPAYNLFRNRAFIDVGGEWVSLGGGGERCQYDRTLKGWKKTRCERSWIS